MLRRMLVLLHRQATLVLSISLPLACTRHSRTRPSMVRASLPIRSKYSLTSGQNSNVQLAVVLYPTWSGMRSGSC